MKTSVFLLLFSAAVANAITSEDIFKAWDANYAPSNVGPFSVEYVKTRVYSANPKARPMQTHRKWFQDGPKIRSEIYSKDGTVREVNSYEGMKTYKYSVKNNTCRIDLGKDVKELERARHVVWMMGLASHGFTEDFTDPRAINYELLVPWLFNYPKRTDVFAGELDPNMVKVGELSCWRYRFLNPPYPYYEMFFAPERNMAPVKFVNYNLSGSLSLVREVTQWGQANGLWYPKEIIEKGYAKGELRTTYSIKTLAFVRHTSLPSDQFVPTLPSGCKVYDAELRLFWIEP
jgi:hypothetical protein